MNTSTTATPTTTETQKCFTCGVEKPLDDFDGESRKKNGKRLKCKECRALYEAKKTNIVKLVEVPRVVWPMDPDLRLQIAVEARMKAYKENATDAIFELAMMPVGGNPLLMQVKLTAACKLAGPLPGDAAAIAAGGGRAQLELDPFLQQLSDAYKATRPRLKEIRERVTVFEDDTNNSPPILIEGEVSSSPTSLSPTKE